MIKSWQHKGLKQFYLTGSKAGIQPAHVRKIKIILQLLDAAEKVEDMNLPGMDFHKLKHDLRDFYSVHVNGNWCVIFKFEKQDAYLVDYCDYH